MSDFATGNLTAAQLVSDLDTGVGIGHVTLGVVGFGSAAFTLAGTFTGTVRFFATGNGGRNWFPMLVYSSDNTVPNDNATLPGLFRANVGAYTHVAMLMATFGSGSAEASIVGSAEPAALLGGGGGGPGNGGGPVTAANVSLWPTVLGASNVQAALEQVQQEIGPPVVDYWRNTETAGQTNVGTVYTANYARIFPFYFPFNMPSCKGLLYTVGAIDNTETSLYGIGVYSWTTPFVGGTFTFLCQTPPATGAVMFPALGMRSCNWITPAAFTPGWYVIGITANNAATTAPGTLGGQGLSPTFVGIPNGGWTNASVNAVFNSTQPSIVTSNWFSGTIPSIGLYATGFPSPIASEATHASGTLQEQRSIPEEHGLPSHAQHPVHGKQRSRGRKEP